MVMTDPIADFLTRIRNANMADKSTADVPRSRVLTNVAAVLVAEGYLERVEELETENMLRLHLRFGRRGEKVITNLKRVSTPGRRIYAKAEAVEPVLGGLGISILSTSQGIIADREARKRRIGGEVLCEVW